MLRRSAEGFPYALPRTPGHQAVSARAGAGSVRAEACAPDEASRARGRLHDGTVDGRAVVLPNG
ncbi:hypothetical protein [Streptomyces griseosporeus]|uniref:hypothetical protein n=1 Tax=Streptomyces griseosporeus TaxID=1910 RepID=UPI0036B0A50C